MKDWLPIRQKVIEKITNNGINKICNFNWYVLYTYTLYIKIKSILMNDYTMFNYVHIFKVTYDITLTISY